MKLRLANPKVLIDLGRIADLEIRWPNGKEQRMAGVKANQVLRVEEPRA